MNKGSDGFTAWVRSSLYTCLFVTEETIEKCLLDTLSAKHELALAILDPDSEIDRVDLTTGLMR